MEGCRKHPDHQRSKNRVKARAENMPGQGGYLGHSRDFEGDTGGIFLSCPFSTSMLAGAGLDVVINTMKEHSSICGP